MGNLEEQLMRIRSKFNEVYRVSLEIDSAELDYALQSLDWAIAEAQRV